MEKFEGFSKNLCQKIFKKKQFSGDYKSRSCPSQWCQWVCRTGRSHRTDGSQWSRKNDTAQYVVAAEFEGLGITFFDFKNKQFQGLQVEGEILVNGQNIGKGVTSVSAYVQQEDLFMGTLTVSSRRLPGCFGWQQTLYGCFQRRRHVVKPLTIRSALLSNRRLPGCLELVADTRRAVLGSSYFSRLLFLNSSRHFSGLPTAADVCIVLMEPPNFQVKEHLDIQAKLRLPPGTSTTARATRVNEVMNEMLLEKPRDSRIGVPGIKKGISGECPV